MINQTLIWFLALPFILGIALFISTRGRSTSAMFSAAFTVACLVIIGLAFGVSRSVATSDVEIINGAVTGKTRVHGTYEESYQCNCSTDSKGHTSCQTCYRTHYTVDWDVQSTVGEIQIQRLDSTWASVYATPDPAFYVSATQGDPVARRHSYTNYIQAVPNSLFTPSSESLKKKFAQIIPAYPDNIHDYYNLNRVLTPGVNVPIAGQLNTDIANALRALGPKKEVNVIIVIANTSDANYEYALRDAWENGNKNDAIVVIGSTRYPKIDFVRIISWTKNELLKVELRDIISDHAVVDNALTGIIMTQVDKNFERRRMREFKYLESEIDPPAWVLILVLVSVFGAAVFAYVTINNRR